MQEGLKVMKRSPGTEWQEFRSFLLNVLQWQDKPTIIIWTHIARRIALLFYTTTKDDWSFSCWEEDVPIVFTQDSRTPVWWYGKYSHIKVVLFLDIEYSLRNSFLNGPPFLENKVRKKEILGIDTIRYHTSPRTPHGKVTKHRKTSHTREPRG